MQTPLASVLPRLQRMILQPQKYNFTIIHRPGKDIPVADTLSRKSLSYQDTSLSEGMEIQEHSVQQPSHKWLKIGGNQSSNWKRPAVSDTERSHTKRLDWGEKKVSLECVWILEPPWWAFIPAWDNLQSKKIVVPTSLRSDILPPGADLTNRRSKRPLRAPGESGGPIWHCRNIFANRRHIC